MTEHPATRVADWERRFYWILLVVVCGVFFWIAASNSDWVAGVCAGLFLAAIILNVGRRIG